MRKFLFELKRRKVYTVAVAFVVGGWALAQGIAQVFPTFDVPIWVIRLIIGLIALGFPVALALSWFFDLTRYGVVRTPYVDSRQMDVSVLQDPTQRSIAVLPFVDLSPNRDHDYFGDGVAEEILSTLSKIEFSWILCYAPRFS